MIRFLFTLIGMVLAVNAWHVKYKVEVSTSARVQIYQKNSQLIIKHNEEFKSGKFTYEQGVNKFTGMDDDEFRTTMNGFTPYLAVLSDHESMGAAKIPDSIDWREKGAVTTVRDQGISCSCCWAFGSLGALEGAYFLKNKKLVEFSAQNLIDCVREDEEVCYVGGFSSAFDYIKTHGVNTYESYPYLAKKNKCHYNKNTSLAKIKDFIRIRQFDESALTEAIATVGPITIGIDALHSLRHYKRGIYYEEKCSRNVSHCVLAVGYGTDDDGNDYYIIKNSWGKDWGEDGYFRMARNRGNNCGVASAAAYPRLED